MSLLYYIKTAIRRLYDHIQNKPFELTHIKQTTIPNIFIPVIDHKAGFKKQEGHSVTEIITLLLVFPLMLLTSVNAFFRSDFQRVTKMKKDVLYRLKNNERMPWRSLLLNVSKQFQRVVNPDQKVADNAAFILDDTVDTRVGRKMECYT